MLKKFNEVCNMILESSEDINLDKTDIHPTCAYCGKDVDVNLYLKQKKSYEEFTGVEFKPSSCCCDKCGEALSRMYSGGTKWTGD